MLQVTKVPKARTELLIRQPVEVVYEAFIDPDITSKVWFSESTGRLDEHDELTWKWNINGQSIAGKVFVQELVPNERIIIDWGSDREHTTKVTWTFSPQGDAQTFVQIVNEGFTGDGDTVVAQAIDSVEGFTSMLTGMKVLLEFGIDMNLLADKHYQP